jgi:hypothetical protein
MSAQERIFKKGENDVNLNLAWWAKQVLSAQERIFKMEFLFPSKFGIALIVLTHSCITSSERPGANLWKFRKKIDKLLKLEKLWISEFSILIRGLCERYETLQGTLLGSPEPGFTIENRKWQKYFFSNFTFSSKLQFFSETQIRSEGCQTLHEISFGTSKFEFGMISKQNLQNNFAPNTFPRFEIRVAKFRVTSR